MAATLFISEYDDVYLPIVYHFSHNLAVRLYDDLVWLLKDEKTQKKTMVKIRFDKKEDFNIRNTEELMLWLKDHDKESVIKEIFSKHLTFAIISDICHFVFQALDSAKNIKMTVAYSLLRKPFLENLLVLEQLFHDEDEFLNRFNKEPNYFDPGKISDQDKRSILENCIRKIKNNELLKPDLLFDIRFNRNNSKSFYAMSNLATHLVTTRYSSYKTETNNLNFIFSGFEEWDAQLSHFYFFLPYILYYTTELVDQYLLEKKIINIRTFRRRKFFRFIGQIVQADNRDYKSIKGKSIANKAFTKISIKCNNCRRINKLFKSDLYSLIHNNYILCKHCLTDLYSETSSFDPLIERIIK